MATKEETIPAGSEVPENEDGQTTDNAAEETTEQNTQTEETETEETKKEGESSEAEELRKQVANLEKVLGRQGKELGDLKKSKTQQEEEPPKDYDALEADIVDKLDAGEMDLKTALRQMNQLASERGAMQATQRFQEEQKQQTSNQMISQFKQNNPDFDEVLESGALDEIIQSNPLHDEFSAYHEFKLNRTQAEIDAKIQQAKEEGKNEGMKIASESSNASKVLGKRGDALRSQQTGKQPTNRAETKAAPKASKIVII